MPRAGVLWQVLLFVFGLDAAVITRAQSTPEQLKPILQNQIQTPDAVALQLRQYLLSRVVKFSKPTTAQAWSAESAKLRKHLLDDVIFHGWPKEWLTADPKFQEVGVVETGNGYRIRKFRYEIVPGFQSVALLYEPEQLRGKIPGILNVNGHEYAQGKAVEYKQKRCINFAKRGMLALSLEWLGCGELRDPRLKEGNQHWEAAELDLVGANAVGLFYLAMLRGLDYLHDHPDVDRSRLGMTGLSGGGWQTITLSSLDERVSVAVPVAGYASIVSEIERLSDTGDFEQIPTDFFVGLDNSHLTAMRAPRPTLLIYNAEDDCCFRAPLVKPYLFDVVQPYFEIFGKSDNFKWHENRDPGTHNYQLDNRLEAYEFFSRHFGIAPIVSEIPVDADIKSYDELVVGLPKDNLTMLGLARKMADTIERPTIPVPPGPRAKWIGSGRDTLKDIVRYRPTIVSHAWAVGNTKNKGVETRSYRFQFSNGLSATGVWTKAITSPASAPATIVLKDDGKQSAATEVSDLVNRGEQVLALDLLLTGDASPADPHAPDEPPYMALLLGTLGDRPVGIEVSQLLATTHWLQQTGYTNAIGIECIGIRNQLRALVAGALEPTLYRKIVVRSGMRSLKYVLDAPVTFDEAPDLFCLDFYKRFDLDQLLVLAEPTSVQHQSYLDTPLRLSTAKN